MLLLSSISNKEIMFIFSTNKAGAAEVPQWVPLEQRVVKVSVDSAQALASTTSTQIESS